MAAIQKEGRPIRPHYFRPLIIPATKEGVDSVVAVLRKMKDYGIQGMALKVRNVERSEHYTHMHTR